MVDHATFAPSGAHRWIACPGSIRMSEGIDAPPSEYAMEGTALHDITENCLRDKIPATQFIGMSMQVKDDPEWSMEFDEDHAEAVQYCVDEVKRITKEFGIKGGKLEVRVELNEDCWGWLDVLLYNDEWVIVIDFKFGRGKSVEAEGNPQLMIYYLGAVKHLADQGIKPPPKAKLIILQPRIPNPTRTWDTTLEEVKTWYIKSVKPAYELAKNGDAPCNPGEEQCQFCPANGVCTARADYLLGIAEEDFKEYAIDDSDQTPPVPTTEMAKDIRTTMAFGLERLTPEIAGKILTYQADFDNFFKRVGEFALQSALDGTPIPGYKLVYGRSNRKWKDESLAKSHLVAELGEDAYNKKILSPAQAEKKLGKGKLDDYIIKPKGKLTLVDAADTREEADLSGEDDMAEFAAESATGSSPDVFEESDSIDEIMSDFKEEKKAETSGDEILQGSDPSPPNKRTKKFKLMEMGLKGGVSISDAAEALFNGDAGQVKKGLRNLNERDGYTVIFHTNETFTVKE